MEVGDGDNAACYLCLLNRTMVGKGEICPYESFRTALLAGVVAPVKSAVSPS